MFPPFPILHLFLICLFIYLFVYLFIYLYIYLYIYLLTYSFSFAYISHRQPNFVFFNSILNELFPSVRIQIYLFILVEKNHVTKKVIFSSNTNATFLQHIIDTSLHHRQGNKHFHGTSNMISENVKVVLHMLRYKYFISINRFPVYRSSSLPSLPFCHILLFSWCIFRN